MKSEINTPVFNIVFYLAPDHVSQGKKPDCFYQIVGTQFLGTILMVTYCLVMKTFNICYEFALKCR